MTELAAQLDVCGRAGQSRILIIFDCTSPVEQLFSFLQMHDRHKIDVALDNWFNAWVVALAKLEMVVFLHTHSHRGCSVSEHVDGLAKEACGDAAFLTPSVSDRRMHVSMQFKRDPRLKVGDDAARAARRLVLQRLRAASHDSLWPEDSDLVPVPGFLPAEYEGVLTALCSFRWFPRDSKRYMGRLGAAVAALPCACGFAGGCSGWHAFTQCPRLRGQRELICDVLSNGAVAVAGASGSCTAWAEALKIMKTGLGRRVHGLLLPLSSMPPEDGREPFWRTLFAMVHMGADSAAAKTAVGRLALVVCRLALAVDEMMRDSVELVRREVTRLRGAERFAKRWRQVAAGAGPIRVAALTVLHSSWVEALWAFSDMLRPAPACRWRSYRGLAVSVVAARLLRGLFAIERRRVDTAWGAVGAAAAAVLWRAIVRIRGLWRRQGLYLVASGCGRPHGQYEQRRRWGVILGGELQTLRGGAVGNGAWVDLQERNTALLERDGSWRVAACEGSSMMRAVTSRMSCVRCSSSTHGAASALYRRRSSAACTLSMSDIRHEI